MMALNKKLRNEDCVFAVELLRWFEKHGRKDLPWQRNPTPYRVWVSEIMLQQTQVVTVIPYFNAFMKRFPSIAALAEAPVDEVLHRWSGLGYYARARNLHRAAQQIVGEHAGKFPRTLEAVMELPGIGRSTAGAVLSLSRDERYPILDGNVKRVLARYFAVEGFPGLPAVSERLWELADRCMPEKRSAEYTQAIMDLGATLCVRRNPQCGRCPVADGCRARASGRQNDLPTPRPRKVRPLRQTCMVIAVRDKRFVLLEKRPPAGLWGGLWGLPQFDSPEAGRDWCADRFGVAADLARNRPVLRHAFTHFDLDIEPLLVDCKETLSVMETSGWVWYDVLKPPKLGLAAPVKDLIQVHTATLLPFTLT